MEFIKPEEARELMYKVIKEELDKINQEINRHATKGENHVVYKVKSGSEYVSQIKDFLEDVGYKVLNFDNGWSNDFSLMISWSTR